MLNLFRSPSHTLIIDRGRVNCPLRRGDVDLEKCATCRWLVSLDPDASPPHLECRPYGPPPTPFT
jgi:hypothetical protein